MATFQSYESISISVSVSHPLTLLFYRVFKLIWCMEIESNVEFVTNYDHNEISKVYACCRSKLRTAAQYVRHEV